ncbi:hypothetical protein NGA_0482200 [Nannochloropsis gaditana CCMP526]|uniref:uncharacterized protein n=1 Tax=Nannochloropsis gaditana (strain CCMP526) TaxID=1093141 RepID=UPI00029F5E5C|nr:hypothetical protein NGA_0482200 [Nannochloropsis gaditana CCMP526]EKU22691.1 hypothetical protein NGA_0482200 [Nannochloropsis gaditana CCMP526]|eukprot:XP_005853667.1 hypothetical protein NGA_0482200 [Nannochloropsis gaditana CCMP526]
MGGAFSSFFQRPSMPPENVPPVSIVVVGASFAGLAAVRTLVQASDPTKRRPFRVTVVEPKGYFEYTPGILRALVAPEHADALCVPLKEILEKPWGTPPTVDATESTGQVTWVKGWLRKIETKSIQVTCYGKREDPPTDGHAVDGSSSRVDEKHPRQEKRTTYTVAVPRELSPQRDMS